MAQEDPNLNSWQRFNVVQGILIHRNQILLVGNDYGFSDLVWSLPGGRLEPGEQQLPALQREFQEETGLAIVPGELLYLVDARSLIDHRHYLTCVFSVHLATETETEVEPDCSNDAAVKQARFVSFEGAALKLRRPSLGEPLMNYLYFGEGLPRRYWSYHEYQRADWQPISWPPSAQIQAD